MEIGNNFPQSLFLSCSSCQNSIEVSTYAQCITVVCPSCNTCFNYINGSLVKANKTLTPFKVPPYIKVGSFGVIKGRKYKLIGIMEKCEHGANYKWREYMLFNPYYGYAFLAEFDGHWTFLEQLVIHPKEVVIKEDLVFDRKWFRFFNKYTADLISASGEFCFDILDESGNKVKELISPPYFLSCESSPDEQVWFYGQYINADEVKSIFNIKADPPVQKGIGACQPLKLSFDYNTLVTFSVILFIVLIGLQVFFSSVSSESRVLKESFRFEMDSSGSLKPLVSQPFEIRNGPTNITFEFRAPVSNSWMEFAVDLVNDNTGEHHEFTTNIEYYFGYEGGENWSEGKQKSDDLLSSIPSGTYHVNIWPNRENSLTGDYVDLEIKSDVPMYSNALIVAGILLIFPLITKFRSNSFERRRWMNSDYSPYDE